MKTRVLAFANSAIAIQQMGKPAERLVDFVFGPAQESSVPPHLTLRITTLEDENTFALAVPGAGVVRGSFGATALALMEQGCYHLADRSQGGALFHAACLVKDAQAFLLPGSSGSGKSTLAVWLASQGFHCLTDELVFLPAGTLECQSFVRPIHLKPTAGRLFPYLEEQGGLPLDHPGGWLVPPALLGGTPPVPPIPLHMILFPHYIPGATLTLEPLSRASTAVSLTGMLVNARNLPEHGFPELLRIARAIPGYQITYSGFEQLGQVIHSTFSSAAEISG